MAVLAQVKVSSPSGHGEEVPCPCWTVLQGPVTSSSPSPGLPGEGSSPLSSPLGQPLWGAAGKDFLSPLFPWPSEGAAPRDAGRVREEEHTGPHCPSPLCTRNSLEVRGKLFGSFYLPALRKLCGFIWLSRRLG